MDKNKLNFITIILAVCVVLGALGGFYLGLHYGNDGVVEEINKDDNKVEESVNEPEDVSKKDGEYGKLPDDIGSYKAYIWNYNEIYNYVMNIDADADTIEISKDDPMKIENKILYWNVEGKWIKEERISGDIKDVVVCFEDEIFSAYAIYVLTNTGNLYRIDGIVVENKFTKDEYNELIVEKLEHEGNIQKVASKVFSNCGAWTVTYVLIDNEVYIYETETYTSDGKILKKGSFKNLKDEVKAGNIYNDFRFLTNDCNPDVYIPDKLELKNDGTISELINEEGKNLNYKYFVSLTKGDSKYILIVDNENNLYVLDEAMVNDVENIYIMPTDKVKSAKAKYSDKDETLYHKNYTLTLELESGKTLTLK